MSARAFRHETIRGDEADHGTRARYCAGCRCGACRGANNARYRARADRVRAAAAEVVPTGPPVPGVLTRAGREYRVLRCPGANGAPCVVPGGSWLRTGGPVCLPCADRAVVWDGLVPAARARDHLRALSAAGVGYKAVADACDVPAVTLAAVAAGRADQIRVSTERRVLAVDASARAAGARVPAGPSRTAIRELLKRGWTRRQISAALGSNSPGLQVAKSRRVKVATEAALLRLVRLARAGKAPPPPRPTVPSGPVAAALRALTGEEWGLDPGWLRDRLGWRFSLAKLRPRVSAARAEALEALVAEICALREAGLPMPPGSLARRW